MSHQNHQEGKKVVSWKRSLVAATKNIASSLPMLVSVVFLISAVKMFLGDQLSELFGHGVLDPIVGAGLGSVMAGNPVTSYVIAGEFLRSGVGAVTVTAFLITWVTVGAVQFPLEAEALGRRFAIVRNVSAFILAIIVAIITAVVVPL